ncbi:hypothetical protein MSAN_01215400 [Mycena sanguinolenta]|uniref:Uncharacterized protein n=1 Tax=Mycena sanguinolenta TaxID=230812 RepID=A0A8H7D1P3_9AGAR|nr:hypothetical protein MSAN_01215400 [Mycena sanguinolenta]
MPASPNVFNLPSLDLPEPLCRLSKSNHHRQTQNIRCISVYHKLVAKKTAGTRSAHHGNLSIVEEPLGADDSMDHDGFEFDSASFPPPPLDSDDSDSEDEDIQIDWEPPACAPGPGIDWPIADGAAATEAPLIDSSMPPEERFVQRPHITKFGGQAGVPLPQREAPTFEQYEAHLSALDSNEWSPFKSRIDWAIARWAKLRGSTSTAFSDLLAIEGLPEALGLSYRTSGELNEIIDKNLPTSRPPFQREEVVVAGEAFDVYFRDIIEYADKTVRLYHDLHTGKWWWATQKTLEKRRPGATIIPIIISTDKTQTTMFRNKSAYPVYMSIGNIPKGIRRKPSRQAYILIGYLPTTRLEHIKVAAARRRAIANLYHACMRKILSPLKAAGLDGIYMASGNGAVC